MKSLRALIPFIVTVFSILLILAAIGVLSNNQSQSGTTGPRTADNSSVQTVVGNEPKDDSSKVDSSTTQTNTATPEATTSSASAPEGTGTGTPSDNATQLPASSASSSS
jgi:cytoskeletal protein RodZ